MSAPNDAFWWGTTSASTNDEGAAPGADWARWERDGRAPRSGDGNGWTTNFIDDLVLLQSLGGNSIRVTAEWARIEPEPGKVDRDAVDRYRRMLQAARANGLDPWLTLVHGSLPGWFADDEHGFRDERARRYFWPRHVDRCAEWFEGSATGWVPIDDPTGWAIRSHLLGTHPPGRRDRLDTRDALFGAIEANQTAAELLRGGGQSTMCVVGVRSPHARVAADELTLDRAAWDYIEALDSGVFESSALGSRAMPQLSDCFEWLGIAHLVAESTDPQILTECVYRVADTTNRPIVIAANGIATAHDETHEQYVRGAVAQITLLRREGVALKGYFHHTGIDGYEWHDGFTRPRGLIGRDRNLKPVGRYMRDMLSERTA